MLKYILNIINNLYFLTLIYKKSDNKILIIKTKKLYDVLDYYLSRFVDFKID